MFIYQIIILKYIAVVLSQIFIKIYRWFLILNFSFYKLIVKDFLTFAVLIKYQLNFISIFIILYICAILLLILIHFPFLVSAHCLRNEKLSFYSHKKTASIYGFYNKLLLQFGYGLYFGLTFVYTILNYKKGKNEKVNFYVVANIGSLCTETSF